MGTRLISAFLFLLAAFSFAGFFRRNFSLAFQGNPCYNGKNGERGILVKKFFALLLAMLMAFGISEAGMSVSAAEEASEPIIIGLGELIPMKQLLEDRGYTDTRHENVSGNGIVDRVKLKNNDIYFLRGLKVGQISTSLYYNPIDLESSYSVPFKFIVVDNPNHTAAEITVTDGDHIYMEEFLAGIGYTSADVFFYEFAGRRKGGLVFSEYTYDKWNVLVQGSDSTDASIYLSMKDGKSFWFDVTILEKEKGEKPYVFGQNVYNWISGVVYAIAFFPYFSLLIPMYALPIILLLPLYLPITIVMLPACGILWVIGKIFGY